MKNPIRAIARAAAALLAGAVVVGGGLAATTLPAAAAPQDSTQVAAPAGLHVDLEVCPMFASCDDPQSLVNDASTGFNPTLDRAYLVIRNDSTAPITVDASTISLGDDGARTDAPTGATVLAPGDELRANVIFDPIYDAETYPKAIERPAFVDADLTFTTSAGNVTANWTMERAGLWNVSLLDATLTPTTAYICGAPETHEGTLGFTVSIEPTDYMKARVSSARVTGEQGVFSPGVVVEPYSPSITADWVNLNFADYVTGETKSHPAWMSNATFSNTNILGNFVNLMNMSEPLWPDDGVDPLYTATLAGIPVTWTGDGTLGLLGKALNATSGSSWAYAEGTTAIAPCTPAPEVVTPVAPVLVPATACETEPTVTVPADGNGVTYTQTRDGNTVTVVATPTDGHVFPEDTISTWTFDVTPTGECPTVTTDAVPTLDAGESGTDVAIITGTVPEGAYLLFDIYRWDDQTERPDTAYFSGTERVSVTGAGEFTSPTFTFNEVGSYQWFATLYDADGNVLAEDLWGAEGERTVVTKVPVIPVDPTDPGAPVSPVDPGTPVAAQDVIRTDGTIIGWAAGAAILLTTAGAVVLMRRRLSIR